MSIQSVESVGKRKPYSTLKQEMTAKQKQSQKKKKQLKEVKSYQFFFIHLHLERHGLKLLTVTTFHHFYYYKIKYEPVPDLYGAELVIVALNRWRSLMEKKQLLRGFTAIQQKTQPKPPVQCLCVYVCVCFYHSPTEPHMRPVLTQHQFCGPSSSPCPGKVGQGIQIHTYRIYTQK